MQSVEAAVDEELTDSESVRLNPKAFSHSEHLRLGFEMLGRYSFPETLQRFSAGLKLLASKSGRPDLYHETKTVAFLSLIAERRTLGKPRNWEEFVGANSDLTDKRCLQALYCEAHLESATARNVLYCLNLN